MAEVGPHGRLTHSSLGLCLLMKSMARVMTSSVIRSKPLCRPAQAARPPLLFITSDSKLSGSQQSSIKSKDVLLLGSEVTFILMETQGIVEHLVLGREKLVEDGIGHPCILLVQSEVIGRDEAILEHLRVLIVRLVHIRAHRDVHFLHRGISLRCRFEIPASSPVMGFELGWAHFLLPQHSKTARCGRSTPDLQPASPTCEVSGLGWCSSRRPRPR